MDATEKKVLKTVSENLKQSTKTDWRNGDVEVWADWAKKMRNTINNSTALLDSLLTEEKPDHTCFG